MARRAVLVVLAGWMLACGGVLEAQQQHEKEAVQKAIEQATGDKVDIGEDGNVHVKAGDADVTVGNATKLPDDFPSDVPIPPDGELQGVMRSTSTPGQTDFTIAWRCKQSPTEIAAFYKGALTGWTVATEAQTGEGSMIVFQSPDKKRNLALSIAPSTGETTVGMVLNVLPPG